jgi:hypothetical protein
MTGSERGKKEWDWVYLMTTGYLTLMYVSDDQKFSGYMSLQNQLDENYSTGYGFPREEEVFLLEL